MARTVHVIVTGRVQGVGYRAWTERKAKAAGLNGWVRNRNDGSVEAVFSGPEEVVGAMLRACSEGPTFAAVRDVAAADRDDAPADGFEVRPTA